MDLSIVIPAFQECWKIARDAEAAAAFLQANRLTGEVIVVDDGSSDNTAEAARAVRVPEAIRLNVIRHEQHRGKGYAVRTGMMASSGKYAMFADCGLCIPYIDALKGLAMLRNGTCEIAHGSRRHAASNILQAQPWHRRVLSQAFKSTVRALMRVPRELTDTQCGFKLYRGDVARDLYKSCITDGFMFDIEIILRAAKKGYRIGEFPVQWACDLDSRLSVTRTPWPVLWDLHRIRRAVSAGRNSE
ncbi:MAG: glycosyltransferase [Sedimentisphaerales bacterium]|nr:glycosyltransferase [Sedimentisphaerales bacterium]